MFTATVNGVVSRLNLDPRGTAPFPRSTAPMLVHKASRLVSSPEWTYEPKWDGFRVIATVRDGSVRLLSRNDYSFTRVFGTVADALRSFPVSLVLDGEVVAITDEGRPDFEALQQRLRPRDGTSPGHLCYLVFDCLYVNGHALLGRPLEERQHILQELRPALAGDAVKLTESFPATQSRRLMEACAAMGLEGVIMKRKGSLYRPGYRSRDWIKVPIRQTEEFIAMGYLAANPTRLSSLILAQYNQYGKLAYTGMVGTGLSEETRGMLLAQLHELKRKTCPCAPVLVLRDHFQELRTDLPPQWVKPVVVVQVEYRQRTGEGLRHAALKGLRPDQSARRVVQSTFS
jgi:bifunctional non-homologous end joining protein LigD